MSLLSKIRKRLEGRDLIKILQLVWESSPRWVAISVILTLIQSTFPVLILYSTKLVLDNVTVALESGADLSSAFNEISVFVVLLATVSGLSIIFQSAIDYSFGSLSAHLTDYLQTILQKKAVEVDLESYENPEYYDILYRAEEEVSFRPANVIFALMRLGRSAISLVGIVILLATFNPLITLVLMVAVFPGIVARFLYTRKLYVWQRENAKIFRDVYYTNSILTDEGTAKENRLFGLSDYFLNRSIGLRDTLREERLTLSRQYHFFEVSGQLITTVVIFSLFGVIIQQTLSGSITIGDLVMYYQAFERGQGYLRGFLGGIVEIYENSLFISNLYEFLELEPKIVDPPEPVPFPDAIEQGIVIKNLNFNYPNSERQTLKDINMTIGAGETIAIVGENGSGKTTLIKLICRLYQPNSGCIEIDGINLVDLKVADLRNNISVVFQDYVEYLLSARENIWLGRIDLPQDSERIISAAKYSGIDAVISKMSKGYDTILGKQLGEGEDLSTGEWQKIAIARAHLRESQILILDEPTSSLDAKAEQEIFEKFRELAEGRSTILISHRLSTIKMADRIYYLNDGIIAESGTHQELIAQQGLYATMFEAQAKNYR